MTTVETEPEITTIDGVTVKWHDEYNLSVEGDYEQAHTDDSADDEHVEGLLNRKPGRVTALYALAGARFPARLSASLAEALTEPYTLRTTRDAAAILQAVRGQLDGLAQVVEGVGTWLTTADKRGEINGGLAATLAQLATAADTLRAAGAPLEQVPIPSDRSPGMDMETVVGDVIKALRARGIEVTEVHVQESMTVWEFANGDHLTLGNEMSWELYAQIGENHWQSIRSDLPHDWYAHPEQIADAVADALSGENE